MKKNLHKDEYEWPWGNKVSFVYHKKRKAQAATTTMTTEIIHSEWWPDASDGALAQMGVEVEARTDEGEVTPHAEWF